MYVKWHNKNPYIDPCVMKIEVPKGPHHYVNQMVASLDGSKVFSMLNDGELRISHIYVRYFFVVFFFDLQYLWNLRTGSLAFVLPPQPSHIGKNYLQAECYAMFNMGGSHVYYFAPNQQVLVSNLRVESSWRTKNW